MADNLSIDQVKHVAVLSRLRLSEAEAQMYAQQLGSILHYVGKIAQVDVSNVEPMAHATPLQNVLREDVAGPSLPLEQVLLNAPKTDGPFFDVPKVVGGDEDSAG